MEGSVKNKIQLFNRGGGAKQLNHRLFFQLSCFDPRPHHDFYFFHCPAMTGAIVCPRPQTKSACTPLQPCARLRWQVCAVGGLLIFSRLLEPDLAHGFARWVQQFFQVVEHYFEVLIVLVRLPFQLLKL
jgi:hypothetical protein